MPTRQNQQREQDQRVVIERAVKNAVLRHAIHAEQQRAQHAHALIAA